MILNNFKKLVSLGLTNYIRVQKVSTWEPTLRKLFIAWDGTSVSFQSSWQDGNSHNNMWDTLNFWPSVFCGTITTVNNATIALPNTLKTEQDFLNNKTFLYGGKITQSKRMSTINEQRDFRDSPLLKSCCGLYMVLGSGDTPPTKEDYKLDNFIPTTDLSIQSYSGVGPNNEYPPTKMCSLTSVYKNNSDENITVKELGICISVADITAYDDVNAIHPHPILLLREVLENPIVMKPEEITSFTIDIK